MLVDFLLGGTALLSVLGRSRGKPGTTHGAADWADLIDVRRAGMLKRKGLLLGDYRGAELYYDDDAPMLLTSPARSGKGTAFILPNSLQFGLGDEAHSIVVNDSKGEDAAVSGPYRESQGRNVKYSNGWHQHDLPNHCFNPHDDLDPDGRDFADDCEGDATMLVGRDGEERGNSAYFKDAATEKLGAYIGASKVLEPPARQNMSTVREYVMLGEEERGALWDRMAALKDENENWEFIARQAGDFEQMWQNSPGEFQAVLSTMRVATKFLESEAMRESYSRSDFSFKEVKNGQADLFIMVPGDRLWTHAAHVRLLLGRFFREMLRPPIAEKKVWVCLDEAATLGRVDKLANMMGAGPGYKMWLCPVFQDRAQMDSLYGKMADTFFSNARLQMCFAAQDLKTSEYFSKSCGKTTVKTQSGSDGRSSWGEAGRLLIDDYEVRHIADHECIILNGNRKPLKARKRAFWEWPKLRNRAAGNPFEVGTPPVPWWAGIRGLCGNLVRAWAYFVVPHPAFVFAYLVICGLWGWARYSGYVS